VSPSASDIELNAEPEHNVGVAGNSPLLGLGDIVKCTPQYVTGYAKRGLIAFPDLQVITFNTFNQVFEFHTEKLENVVTKCYYHTHKLSYGLSNTSNQRL